MLLDRPAGISWAVIPRLNASTAEQVAQLEDVCRTSVSVVDSYCLQPLRSSVVTETAIGPGLPRVGVDRNTGIGTLITRRRFVAEALAVQVSPARAFPPRWALVTAGQFSVRHPMAATLAPVLATGPDGGTVIDVAPGWITRDHGRGGLRVMNSYASGWPHAGLTADAAEAAESVTVDDVTGWGAIGAGIIYDGASTEEVQVTAADAAAPLQLPGAAGTVPSGPGTLTLAAPLAFAHDAGAVISALPAAALHAAALAAAVQALEGIDAIATQSLSGQMAGGTGALATEMEMVLDDFRRVI
jgi:hypothetical protein